MYGNVSRSGTSSSGTPQQRHDDTVAATHQRPSTRRGGRPGSDGRGASGSGGGTGGTTSGEDNKSRNTTGEGSSASKSNGSSNANNGDSKRHQAQPVVVDVWTRRNSDKTQQQQQLQLKRGSASSASSSSSASSASSSASSSNASKRLSNGGHLSPGTDQQRQQQDSNAYPELSEPERYTDDQFESDEDNGGARNAAGEGEQFTKQFHELVAASQRTRSLRDPLHSVVAQNGAVHATQPTPSPPLPDSADRSRPSTTPPRSVPSRKAGSAASSNGDDGMPMDGSKAVGSPPATQKVPTAPFVSRFVPAHVVPTLRRSTSSATTKNSNSDEKKESTRENVVVQKTPLGFGSSSSRGFILSASGRSAQQPDLRRRPRNASAPSVRQQRDSAEDSATYKAWLRQKQEAEQARRHREAEKRKNEADKQAEKKELAKMNFDRWKREMEKRIVGRKAVEKRAAMARVERENRAKAEKMANAEKTFEHWKATEDQRLRHQRERAQSALAQRQADEQRRKDTKLSEANTAFRDWLQNVRQKESARKEEREHAEQLDREQKEEAEKRKKQVAREAYELWKRMKSEERRYTQSLAFRILDFERQAAQRWCPTPWKPTNPSTTAKICRPPPGQANGRRRTLERRLVLPFSRLSSEESKRKTQKHADKGQRSASTQRPWR